MIPEYVYIVLLVSSCLQSSYQYGVGRRPQVVGCIIGLNYDLPTRNEPLLLVHDHTEQLSLAMPEIEGKYSSISLREGEELVVACPGKKNALELTQEGESVGICQNDNVVSIGRKELRTNELGCRNRVTASLNDTGRPCARGKGTTVLIGFKVRSWFTLLETCHDKENSVTYYSNHKLYGSSLAGKVAESYRPGFSRGGRAFYKGLSPDQVYSQRNQERVFEELFGGELGGKYLDRTRSRFLARGHLAPDADFLFGTWQFLTYYYINAAPQWQSINAGSWLALENSVRKMAMSLGADLDVTTGTHGILRLADAKGSLQEVYLGGKGRLPAPELYWKVLHNPQDDSCIALISTNDPFLTRPPETICDDVCAKHGWPDLQSDLAKGYVYCCSYEDFKRVVPDSPNYSCKSVLEYHS